MDSNVTPQPAARPGEFGSHAIDPKSQLHTQMRVIGEQGKPLGKIDSLIRDTNTGVLSAIVVRHGLLRRDQTLVPVEQVKQVNQDSLVLRYSQAAFKKLPKMATSS
jgi:sporulation protein YlmC with PRC-barrel domain